MCKPVRRQIFYDDLNTASYAEVYPNRRPASAKGRSSPGGRDSCVDAAIHKEPNDCLAITRHRIELAPFNRRSSRLREPRANDIPVSREERSPRRFANVRQKAKR